MAYVGGRVATRDGRREGTIAAMPAPHFWRVRWDDGVSGAVHPLDVKFLGGFQDAAAGICRPAIRRCRVCGCTDDNACLTAAGPCCWVAPDLCSACAAKGGYVLPSTR
jgi:hypothetical protein